jgi:hypothetical protein
MAIATMRPHSFYNYRVEYQTTDKIGEYIPILVSEPIPYDGPWGWCGGGGDPVAQEQEQAQANFDNQLITIFQSQYATQQSQLNYLNGKMQPIINEGGQGYTPEQLTSMRTEANDTTSAQYQQAQDALNNEVSNASGGSKLTGVSGAVTESDAALLNAEAQSKAGAQENITAQNAQLQQQNYWNAINALNGVAAMENPLGYAGAATNAANSVANNSQANSAAMTAQNGWMGMVGGIAGGVGSALGGGFSKGGLFGCWIAASIYGGWDTINTWLIRVWLHKKAPAWFRNFYLQYGERISRTPLRWTFLPVFEGVLRFA